MKDILVNDDFEVQFANGDFAVGESSRQSVNLVVATSPGEWKLSPVTGVGGSSLVGANDRFADRLLRLQLQADGFKLNYLKIGPGAIEIDGKY